MIRLMRLPVSSPMVALAIAGGLAGAVIALWLGFVPEWDMLNYHLYNPHALLTGRLSLDIAPAQMQTFLNPLFHLPHYLLFRQSSPHVLVFITGLVQGAQLALLVALAARLVAPHRVPVGALLVVGLLGLGGPVFLSELGATQGDTVLSALVLAGLLRTLPGPAGVLPHFPNRNAALAGVLLGVATALKLVFGIYAAALGVAILLCTPGRARWGAATAYGAGAAAGLLVVGGPWFAWLWAQYHSPLFPYFNQLFMSEWAGQGSFRDLRFMPRSTLDWVAYPVVWLLDPQRVWEWPFRDVRPILLLPAALLSLLIARRRLPSNLAFVAVFVLASYIAWLSMFSIYRYLAVLEMLAPLTLFALLVHWRPGRQTALVGLAILLATQALVRFDRAQPLPELRADQPSLLAALPRDALIVINGYAPVAFTALWLDDDIPMVRVRANFMPREAPMTRLRAAADERVRTHQGPLYLLLSPEDITEPFLRSDLEQLGLAWSGHESCEPVFPDPALDQRLGLRLCPLTRRTGLFQIAPR